MTEAEIVAPSSWKCACCGTTAESTCKKCMREHYCGRECQVKHWPRHKLDCFTEEQREQLRAKITDEMFQKICRCIAGNVLITNAWYGGGVTVLIDESLEELRERGVHFLHICSNGSDATTETDLNCKIEFKLTDYKHHSSIRIGMPASEIRQRHKKPTPVWTLMYDL